MKKCACTLNVPDSLENIAWFIGHGLGPFGFVYSLHLVSIILGLACAWAYDSVHDPWLDDEFAC